VHVVPISPGDAVVAAAIGVGILAVMGSNDISDEPESVTVFGRVVANRACSCG
jgi:hypothetical protein